MLEAGKKLQSFMPEVTAITSSLCLAYGAGRGSSVFKSKASTDNKNNTYTCVSVYDATLVRELPKLTRLYSRGFAGSGSVMVSCHQGAKYLARVVVFYRSDSRLFSSKLDIYIIYIYIYIYIFSSNIIVKLDILSASFWARMRPDFPLGHLAGKIPKMPPKCFLDASTYFPDAPRCFQRFPRCLPAPLSPMCHGHLPTGAPGENQLFMFWCLCIWST